MTYSIKKTQGGNHVTKYIIKKAIDSKSDCSHLGLSEYTPQTVPNTKLKGMIIRPGINIYKNGCLSNCHFELKINRYCLFPLSLMYSTRDRLSA